MADDEVTTCVQSSGREHGPSVATRWDQQAAGVTGVEMTYSDTLDTETIIAHYDTGSKDYICLVRVRQVWQILLS